MPKREAIRSERDIAEQILVDTENELVRQKIMRRFLYQRSLVEGNPAIGKMLERVDLEIQEKIKLKDFLKGICSDI